MSIRRAILAMVVLNAMAIVYYSVISYRRSDAKEQALRKVGAEWQLVGYMSEDEYVQMRHISERVLARQSTDADIDWLLSLSRAHRKPVAQARIAGILQAAMSFSPRMRERVFTETYGLLTSPSALEREYGVTLQGSLHDPRAVPALLPLLRDPDPNVRAVSKFVLAKSFGFDDIRSN